MMKHNLKGMTISPGAKGTPIHYALPMLVPDTEQIDGDIHDEY